MKNTGFPMAHRALLALLVLLILVAYLTWRPDQDAEDPLLADEAVTLESTKESARLDQMADSLAASVQNASPAEDPQPETLEAGALQPAAEPVTEPAAEPIEAEPSTAERPPVSVVPEASAREEAETLAAEAPAVAEQGPEATAREPVRVPAPQAASADGPQDAAWILAQPPDRFTLQLLSSSSFERASAYVEQRSRPQDFALYRLQRNGKLLHVVIYGNYGTRAEAERAAAGPEATAGGVKPWIRPFKQVQGAVRTVAQ